MGAGGAPDALAASGRVSDRRSVEALASLQRRKTAIEIGLERAVAMAHGDRSGFGLFGLSGPSFEKLMRLHYPRRYAAATT
jgi:hypothetical protein